MNRKNLILLVSLIVITTIGLFFVPNFVHPFDQKSSQSTIFFSIRLPGMLTAIFCGSALAVSGFVLQQLFKNNLAGPYILGVSSGASLAVAILIISAGFFHLESYGLSIPLAGFAGAFTILLLIMMVSSRFGYGAIILLFGVIIGQLSGALQSLLSYVASPGELKLFTLWSMGSFGHVIDNDLIILVCFSLAGMVWSYFLMPALSVMVLGDDVAKSLGVNTGRISMLLLICTGLLTGMSTAYCGPIAFIGMAVPNVSRILVKSADFKVLLISNALLGALMAVISQLISNLGLFSMNIPVNVTTALIGGPIIIHILLRNRH